MIEWHTTQPDPSIQMRIVRVIFDESQYNYQTSINGTRKEIGNYFRGSSLNVANYPDEIMRTPICLNFLSENEDDTTIAMDIQS